MNNHDDCTYSYNHKQNIISTIYILIVLIALNTKRVMMILTHQQLQPRKQNLRLRD